MRMKRSGKGEPPTIISRDRLGEMLFEILKDLKLNDFVHLLTNEIDEVIQYHDLTHGRRGCQKMSLLFNPHRLAIKAKGARDSIYGALKYEWFSKGLARAMLFKRGNSTNSTDLMYYSLQIGINGVQYINEFPPHIAVELCRNYTKNGNRSEMEVLDPCGGWGGRMIGSSVIVNKYTCFEPESRTYSGLINLSNYIRDKRLNPEFNSKVYQLPFEDSSLPNNYYDFAFTSPPYYDTEEYSEEETNSLNRYTTFTKWVEGFYIPMIQKTMDALKPGKAFILNIGDRKYPLSKILLENFGGKYPIIKLKGGMSDSGLNRIHGKGESFYTIIKNTNGDCYQGVPRINPKITGFFD